VRGGSGRVERRAEREKQAEGGEQGFDRIHAKGKELALLFEVAVESTPHGLPASMARLT
jgi:hypothetical protein